MVKREDLLVFCEIFVNLVWGAREKSVSFRLWTLRSTSKLSYFQEFINRINFVKTTILMVEYLKNFVSSILTPLPKNFLMENSPNWGILLHNQRFGEPPECQPSYSFKILRKFPWNSILLCQSFLSKIETSKVKKPFKIKFLNIQ